MLVGLCNFGVVMILSSFSDSCLKMSQVLKYIQRCFGGSSYFSEMWRPTFWHMLDARFPFSYVHLLVLQTVCYVPMQVVSGSTSEMRYPFLYQCFFHFVKPFVRKVFWWDFLILGLFLILVKKGMG
jgi:hypothetical protein